MTYLYIFFRPSVARLLSRLVAATRLDWLVQVTLDMRRMLTRKSNGIFLLTSAAAVAAAFCAVLMPASAAAAPVTLTILQLAEDDGSVDYTVRTQLFGPATLSMPDGTSIPFATFELPGLTYSQLSARAFGTWTIHQSSPAATYSFSVSAILPGPISQIVSPADGATEGPTFGLDWSYPGGENPLIRSVQSIGLATVNFDLNVPGPHAMAHVDLAGQPSAELTIRAGTQDNLLSNISAVTPLGPGGLPAYTVNGSLLSLSPSIHVTVVPEPSSIVLATIGLIGFAASGCRRRKRRAHSRRRRVGPPNAANATVNA